MDDFFTIDNKTINIKEISHFETYKTYIDKWDNRNNQGMIETCAYMNNKMEHVLFRKHFTETIDYDNLDVKLIGEFHKKSIETISSIVSKKEYI